MVRLAYDRKRAAEALCMGVDHFDAHVRPHLKPHLVEGKVLYRHVDLERFLNRASA
jgi:hypothetical protein